MEPEQNSVEQAPQTQKHPVLCATPASKYLAMALFIILPFAGGWVGYTYAPEKVIEIEKVVYVQKEFKETTKSEEKLLTFDLPFGSIEDAVKQLTRDANGNDPEHNVIPGYNIDTDPHPRDLLIDNVGPSLPGERFTSEIVKQHGSVNDCYIVRENRVYNITGLLTLEQYLGSIALLRDKCGSDVTLFIESQEVAPGSLNTARFRYALANFFVGPLTNK